MIPHSIFRFFLLLFDLIRAQQEVSFALPPFILGPIFQLNSAIHVVYVSHSRDERDRERISRSVLKFIFALSLLLIELLLGTLSLPALLSNHLAQVLVISPSCTNAFLLLAGVISAP